MNNYQQLEHQTGLILTPLDNVTTTTQVVANQPPLSTSVIQLKHPIKCQKTIHTLRVLRDVNPSLQMKLTKHSNNNDYNDTLIEYWNSIQDIVLLNEEDHSIKGLDLGGLMIRIKTLIPFMNALLNNDTKNSTTDNKADYNTTGCDNNSFQKLELLNLGGTDIPLSDLLEALQLMDNKHNGYIQNLYLSGCSISCQRNGIQNLNSIMSTTACSNITTLDLRYNDLLKSKQTNETDVEDLMSLFRNVLSQSKIEILHLEGNNLDSKMMESISEILSHPKSTLKELYLGSNKVQPAGAKFLANGLQDNTVLQKLYIECNFIGDEGVHEFCSLLEKARLKQLDDGNRSIALNKLWVENNGVGKEMMKRLGRALQSDGFIQEV